MKNFTNKIKKILQNFFDFPGVYKTYLFSQRPHPIISLGMQI